MEAVVDDVLLPDAPVSTASKPSRAKRLLPLLLGLAVLGASTTWLLGRGKESTDDAFVEGRVASVAPRVSAAVKAVHVVDNQRVKAGDVLVELDDRDYQVRVKLARADLAAAKASLHGARTQSAVKEVAVASDLSVAQGGIAQASAASGSSRAGIEQAAADVRAAEVRATHARNEARRGDQLYASGAYTQLELDARKTSEAEAEASLAQAQARLVSARANAQSSFGAVESARGRLLAAKTGPEQVEAAKAQVELAEARVAQSEASLEQAELALSYTRIVAPVDGVVSRRNVEVGQLVAPERPLFALVPEGDVWVVANFKEDQLAHMREGQHVELDVDAFPDAKLTGTVESFAAGTGSRFSLLPPDNASGNFTKVVQRVPVLIRLQDTGSSPLRPGMSVEATVHTR